MKTIDSNDALRQQVGRWHKSGKTLAFVPTMGNLHDGHLTLLSRAREIADRVVVSIFVNPLQFGPFEDYDQYPRTPDSDQQMLAEMGIELLFEPRVSEMYPLGREQATRVEVPGLSDILCGMQRPGHFVGVATVVAKLFNIVRPDFAVFGEKDFQQLVVIRRMTADLCMPVEIIGAPTHREADGLAMSSRNQYLTGDERARAADLFQALTEVARQVRTGRRAYEELCQRAVADLAREGFRPHYVEVRRTSDLGKPDGDEVDLVVLGAAQLGRARLIDNVRV